MATARDHRHDGGPIVSAESMRPLTWPAPLALALLLAGAFPLAAPPAPAASVQDFSSMPVDTCIDDGAAIGAWTFVYDGFGCTGFVSLDSNIALIEQPQASAQPTETHAGLALGAAT